MELTKVYIITTGEYSDYTIVSVFVDKGKAERYCKFFPDCYVEEWEISEDISSKVDSLLKQGLYPFYYRVSFDLRDGELYFKKDWVTRMRIEDRCNFDELSSTHIPEIHAYRDRAVFYTQMSARDEEHALKIGRDRLAVAKARYEGIT